MLSFPQFSKSPTDQGKDSASNDFTHKEFDWGHYDSFRPILPDTLFHNVFQFHQENCGRFNVAVDAGTGSGAVLFRWADLFETIHAIDPNTQPLTAALGGNTKKIIPHEGQAEDMSFLKDQSVDFLASSVSAHFYDRSKWVPEVSRVLSKGGTLSFWSYSPLPYISTADSSATKLFAEHLNNCIPADYAPPNEHTQGLFLGLNQDYDCVELPPTEFENVRRICWNRQAFFPPVKKQPGELSLLVDDPDFITREWNVAQLHEYHHTLGDFERAWIKRDGKAAQDQVDETWKTLEEEFGGPDGVKKIYWACFLVLATRK